jgi:hypothetical protein
MFVQYLDSYISYSLVTVAVLFTGWIIIEYCARSSPEVSS